MLSNCAHSTKSYSSPKSFGVSPGWPVMNVVRMAMSGTSSRMRAIISRYSFGEPGRRIRPRTFAETCCSGMSQ
jgi:hypothetical protein